MSRLASQRTALILGGIELAMFGAVLALGSLVPRLSSGGAGVTVVVLVAAFFGVGALVAYKRPGHAMGWMLLGVSGFFLLTGIGGEYSVLDYTQHHGDLPLGPVAVLLQPSWAPAIALLVLSILLYPDGKTSSRRWRWPLRWLAFIAVAWQLGAFAIAATTLLTSKVRLDAQGDLQQINAPSGIWAWWGIVQELFFLTVFILVLAWAVGQIRGYRKLTGERRVQQKWLLTGASFGVASIVLFIPAGIASHPGTALNAISDVALVGVAMLPVAIGVGILKYRLYDIDRVISRTLSYAVITALLAGVFVGLVALTTDVLPFSSTVGVAASTLAAAALFNPLRVRVQHAVDRRFNRARYDAEETVAAFSARLRDAVDLDAVRSELLETVQRAVEPAHATIWLRSPERQAAPR